jgi:hypothetical protein
MGEDQNSAQSSVNGVGARGRSGEAAESRGLRVWREKQGSSGCKKIFHVSGEGDPDWKVVGFRLPLQLRQGSKLSHLVTVKNESFGKGKSELRYDL